MTERTTLADLLSQIFEKLDQAIPAHSANAPTLLNAWTQVLGGNGRSAFDIVDSIGKIASILIKLELQIKESKRLKDIHKNSAMGTLEQFKSFFRLEKFNLSSTEFKQFCNATHRGNLGLIGASLEAEFSETKLDQLDAEQLISELREIKDLISTSIVSLDLRVNLSKYVDTMIWWLSNPEFASMQEIFEIAGSTIIIGSQIKDRNSSSSDSDSKAANDLFDRLSKVAIRLGQLVGFVAKGVENADRLSTDIHHLLGSGGPLG